MPFRRGDLGIAGKGLYHRGVSPLSRFPPLSFNFPLAFSFSPLSFRGSLRPANLATVENQILHFAQNDIIIALDRGDVIRVTSFEAHLTKPDIKHFTQQKDPQLDE